MEPKDVVYYWTIAILFLDTDLCIEFLLHFSDFKVLSLIKLHDFCQSQMLLPCHPSVFSEVKHKPHSLWLSLHQFIQLIIDSHLLYIYFSDNA
jgi:hypothetical protein